MDKIARLEAEADRRSAALAAAASRFARRFTPLKLADEALSTLGPASEVVARASGVARRYPLAAAALALSAAFLAWRYFETTHHLASASRKSLPVRRPGGSAIRKLAPGNRVNEDKGGFP